MIRFRSRDVDEPGMTRPGASSVSDAEGLKRSISEGQHVRNPPFCTQVRGGRADPAARPPIGAVTDGIAAGSPRHRHGRAGPDAVRPGPEALRGGGLSPT